MPPQGLAIFLAYPTATAVFAALASLSSGLQRDELRLENLLSDLKVAVFVECAYSHVLQTEAYDVCVYEIVLLHAILCSNIPLDF